MITKKNKFLITGAAGFIGAALVRRMLKEGIHVIGIDNLNSYYDVNLKKQRLKLIDEENLSYKSSWKFYKADITDTQELNKIFAQNLPDVVINLAAQAGVRYSIENPLSYVSSNLVGFSNILEFCRKYTIKNLIYASSSSVYGWNSKLPFSEDNSVDHPVSLYAATKKSNELLAHSYSHLYKIPTTGLRFFTVYGPWGRPDIAPMIFAKNILKGKPIKVFNNGDMERDFTYIDDIVEGVFQCCFKQATVNSVFENFNPESSTSFAPYRIFNIGNNKAVNLLKFISILEDVLGTKAIMSFEPMQPGDVKSTAASIDKLMEWVNFKPNTPIEVGLKEFAKWFVKYSNN